MQHKIAIISDTHSLIRPEIQSVIKDCEVILHAGDIANQKTVNELKSLGNIYFVRGNADSKLTENLPEALRLELFGFNFYMVHNKKHIPQNIENTDFVIYGHSHKYDVNENGGVTFINPGSCGPRRFNQPITMAVLTVEDEKHTFEIQKNSILVEKNVQMPQNIDISIVIKHIIKDMNAGRSVDAIASKNHVEPEFVRQILQIYTTHPGIDIEGILNRMDILGK